ncbi:MAG: LysM peptidoglycan-binding domain-containing protein [Bacteroidia bacterium]|nr:LysM peptidoglycan-binding domain-containing protein [Bacteroidia bacterium]
MNRRTQKLIVVLVSLLLAGSSVVGQMVLEYLPPEGETSAPAVYQTHEVKSGESLFGIARKYGVPMQELIMLNRLADNTIHPDQVLLIPSREPLVSASPAPVPATATARMATPAAPLARPEPIAVPAPAYTASARTADVPEPEVTLEGNLYHLVKPGENLYTIADQYHIPAEALRLANAVTDIQPGQSLVIPTDPDWKYTPVSPAAAQRTVTPRSQARTSPEIIGHLDDLFVAAAPVTRSEGSTRSMTPAVPMDTRSAQTTLTAPYIQVEKPGLGNRFYLLHPTLPTGTRVHVHIPGNAGHVEVLVAGPLDIGQPETVGLSAACVRLIQGAGGGDEVTYSLAYP